MRSISFIEKEAFTIMTHLRSNILNCIGNTSLLTLRNIAPANGARILLKIESENPTGSMKDRMALAMIEAAEADGRLAPNGPVVEYTGGSTGVSLALVCAVKRHPLHIVTSDAFAREKLDHMRILGAKLKVLHSDSGRMTGTGRCIDGFVQSVGTAASLRGTGEALRRLHPAISVVAVEPAESAVLSGGPPGAHKIDGIGAGFVVPLWQKGLADRIETVSTQDANAMALRLAREEGIFAGTSTGANVIAALRQAERLGRGSTVVSVMCDTGMKYLKNFATQVEAEA